MKMNLRNTKRGLTLTELLVVMLIIGLLATIAIPVYTARQEDARVRVALGECREIAHAEEQVAIFHGFYVPFHLLDELPARRNTITNEERMGEQGSPTSYHLIDPFIRAVDQGTQPTLNDSNTLSPYASRVDQLKNNWHGPFMTFQRYYTGRPGIDEQPGDLGYENSTYFFFDYPLDPWGNPYRLYSPIGIVGNSLTFDFIGPDTNNFNNGQLTTLDDRFQRYTVISFGRDGKSDTVAPANNLTNPNDIFYEFGTDGVESNFGRIY